MSADARYRFEIDNELAFRVAIAGMEGLTIAGTALYQLTALTLRTRNRRFIRLINLFRMLTFRLTATANKHAETALT